MNQASAAPARGVDFTLPEQVTVTQTPDVVRDALRAVAGRAAPWRIDAAGLDRFDSACLALLMELRRHAGPAGIELLHVPDRLRTLAHAYGVAFVIDASAEDTTLAEDLAGEPGAKRS